MVSITQLSFTLFWYNFNLSKLVGRLCFPHKCTRVPVSRQPLLLPPCSVKPASPSLSPSKAGSTRSRFAVLLFTSPPLLSPRIPLAPPHFLCGPHLQLACLGPFGHPAFRRHSFDPAVFLQNLVFSRNDSVCFASFFTLHTIPSDKHHHGFSHQSLFFFYSCEMYVYCYF